MFMITPEQCNSISIAMDAGVTFELVKGWVYLSWDYGFGPQRRRWDAREGSHFPSWHRRHAGWGGTSSSVFDQMVRAVQGKPVVPLDTWQYWIEGPAKLCSGHGVKILAVVASTGWPDSVPCILCGKQIKSVGDWWTIGEKGKRISGPSCSMSDCRKVPS